MRIGIDLGGTKVEAVVLDHAGQVIARRREPTPAGDYQGTLRLLSDLVQKLELEVAAACTVGLGTPGSASRLQPGRMKNCNSTCLNGQYLQRDLENLLGKAVRMANDADCLAISETSDGAAAGASPVFAVILGTGVGGGLTVAGRVVQGADGNSGEWGHNPMPQFVLAADAPPRPCYCGRENCVETWLSGAGLVATARSLGVGIDSGEALVPLLVSGEPAATRAFQAYCTHLAAALAGVINLLDPQVIVFGGGVSRLPGLCEGVADRLAPFVFSDQVAVALRTAQHGDASGVRGAAWLWPAETESPLRSA